MSTKKVFLFALFGILYFIIAALGTHYTIYGITQLLGLPVATRGLFSFSVYCTKMPVQRTAMINIALFLIQYGYWCLSVIFWMTGIVILALRRRTSIGKATYWVITLLTNIPLLYAILYLATWIIEGRFNVPLSLLSIGAVAFSLYYYFNRIEASHRKYIIFVSIPAFVCTHLCWMYLH